MSGGIAEAAGRIRGGGDDHAGAGDDRAHGHLAQFHALARFGDGFTHEVDISRFHQGNAPVPP